MARDWGLSPGTICFIFYLTHIEEGYEGLKGLLLGYAISDVYLTLSLFAPSVISTDGICAE